MARKPQKLELTAESPKILNAIRDSASPEYQNLVPVADDTIYSLREIGGVMMTYQPIRNEFLNALINRIANVIVSSRMYYNPWSFFKRGLLEFGETTEEIFVNLASPHQFSPAKAEQEVFKRVIPDVKSAFHSMNYQKFYKQTISNDMLKQAFLSWEGVTDLIGRITDSIYTGANQDEFIVMKYMIQRAYLDGNIKTIETKAIAADTVKSITAQAKALSNTLTFLNSQYNQAGVSTSSNKSDQIVIMDTIADATLDVELLAGAFNLPYADLLAQRVMIDSFSETDDERLALIFDGDASYVPFTLEEKQKLQNIQMGVFDRDWFMIFDNLQEFTEIYNPEGLYWNYFLHVWKTFSYSPFQNAVLLVSTTPDPAQPRIDRVILTPTEATADKGDTVNFTQQ